MLRSLLLWLFIILFQNSPDSNNPWRDFISIVSCPGPSWKSGMFVVIKLSLMSDSSDCKSAWISQLSTCRNRVGKQELGETWLFAALPLICEPSYVSAYRGGLLLRILTFVSYFRPRSIWLQGRIPDRLLLSGGTSSRMMSLKVVRTFNGFRCHIITASWVRLIHLHYSVDTIAKIVIISN